MRFYDKRSTVEQWIKEGKLAVNWTRLTRHRFRGNEARMQMSVLRYNLKRFVAKIGVAKDDWELVADEL